MGDWKYKKKRIEQGICLMCSKPATAYRYCPKHYWWKLQIDRKYRREHKEYDEQVRAERKQRYRDEGRCPDCGSPVHGTVYCSFCQGQRAGNYISSRRINAVS